MNNIEKKIIEFENWYKHQLPHHEASVRFFSELIATIPKVETVSGRTKNYAECISKFKRKYLPQINADDDNYQISEYLTDLIGIRAICSYSEDVNDIRRSLLKFFREIDKTDKSNQLEKTDDKFGYKSLHLQLVLKSRIKGIPEATKYKNIKIELQIRTVIQDAWSILDHKIKYKKSIPHNLKRRINRLSALFEIADDEFLNIQKEISNEENKVSKRLKKGSKIEKSKTLDVFRFLFVALKYFADYNFIEYKVDGFVQELLLQKNNFTEGELNEALQKNLLFVDSIEHSIKQQLNPYTKIRYCLYKWDIKHFKAILSPHQKEVFNGFTNKK
jgi:ppGpp synthetase/RelA/SpoT-type nucleotidyltranferase